MPDNVSSPVPASSSSSLFTNNFTKNLPIDYSGLETKSSDNLCENILVYQVQVLSSKVNFSQLTK